MAVPICTIYAMAVSLCKDENINLKSGFRLWQCQLQLAGVLQFFINN